VLKGVGGTGTELVAYRMLGDDWEALELEVLLSPTSSLPGYDSESALSSS
jgi:hypothetical protein